MRKIEIPFKGTLIFQTMDDLPEDEIREKALKSLFEAEVKANEKGNPRLHITTDLKKK